MAGIAVKLPKWELSFPEMPISSPALPVTIKVEGKVAIEISVKGPDSKLQFTFSPNHKLELERKLTGALKQFSVKGAFFEAGKPTKLSIEWTPLNLPITAVGANVKLDISSPFSVYVNQKNLIKAWRLTPNLIVEGTFTPEFAFNFGPNYSSPSFWVWAKAAAKSGWSRLARFAPSAARGVGTAVQGVFVAGELGTVTAAGAYTIAGGGAVAGIAWLGYCAYQTEKAHEDGRKLSLWSTFASGFAEALADATCDNPKNTQTATQWKALLGIDWKKRMEDIRPNWIKGDLKAFARESWVVEAGKAAVLQDMEDFLEKEGDEAWKRVKILHNKKYGASASDRKMRYFDELFEQIKAGKDALRIPFETWTMTTG